MKCVRCMKTSNSFVKIESVHETHPDVSLHKDQKGIGENENLFSQTSLAQPVIFLEVCCHTCLFGTVSLCHLGLGNLDPTFHSAASLPAPNREVSEGFISLFNWECTQYNVTLRIPDSVWNPQGFLKSHSEITCVKQQAPNLGFKIYQLSLNCNSKYTMPTSQKHII